MSRFHPGIIDGIQKRDESGVAAFELIELLDGLVFDQQALAAATDLDMGYLSNLLNGKQPFIGLKNVDKILFALDSIDLLAKLTVIPNHQFSDARQMAYYEYLDENDQPEADEATILERAEELWALREMMLSGDPEAVEFAREAFKR